jgi:hypothetical protein
MFPRNDSPEPGCQLPEDPCCMWMYHEPLFVSVIGVRKGGLQLAAPLTFSVKAIH